MTWARAYIKEGVLWMDVGKGEVVKLPPAVRDAWWEGTTRQWPFMAADMGISQETLMAHYLSNHVAVAYGDVFEEMVALSLELGFKVRVLGKRTLSGPLASTTRLRSHARRARATEPDLRVEVPCEPRRPTNGAAPPWPAKWP